MFINRPVKKTKLDETIDNLLDGLAGYTAEEESYATMVDQLTKLYAIKSEEKTDRLSKDTLALVAGNLFGILLIVGHERAHVVVSKALPFVGKFK